MANKPSVLVLGGSGFIGRHVVTQLVEQDLASFIRVVDKVLPATAYLTERQQAAFAKTDFKQGNLVNADVLASVEKVFALDGFEGQTKWDWVINLASETKYSLGDTVYEEKVLQLSLLVAKEAVKRNAGVFIEVSTAQVYDADKKASDENGKTKPWTAIAKYKLKAEDELKKITGLNWVIVRPAIVYGIGDLTGITPRLVVAATYKQLKEEMKLLWNKDLRINTVHVDDVAKALIKLSSVAAGTSPDKNKVLNQTFNLVDKNDTDQEKINLIIKDIYGIATGFQGSIISNLAKLNFDSVVEEINEKHMQPWSDLCKQFNINSSPLNPYLDKELLYNNSLAITGTKIEETIDFKYSVPLVTKEKIQEVIDNFIALNLFPKGFL